MDGVSERQRTTLPGTCARGRCAPHAVQVRIPADLSRVGSSPLETLRYAQGDMVLYVLEDRHSARFLRFRRDVRGDPAPFTEFQREVRGDILAECLAARNIARQ